MESLHICRGAACIYVLVVVPSLGVDVVRVRHQRPPHQALLHFPSSSSAAAPFVYRGGILVAGVQVHLISMAVLGCSLVPCASRCVVEGKGEEQDRCQQ